MQGNKRESNTKTQDEAGTLGENLIGALTNCSQKNLEETELFIVEGDSVGEVVKKSSL